MAEKLLVDRLRRGVSSLGLARLSHRQGRSVGAARRLRRRPFGLVPLDNPMSMRWVVPGGGSVRPSSAVSRPSGPYQKVGLSTAA